jgi:maltooligosyltrehalose synthase
MHGYDVVDPPRINPELGDEKELRRLSKRCGITNSD